MKKAEQPSAIDKLFSSTVRSEAPREIQAERLVMVITELLCEVMEQSSVTRAELATRLGKKAAFIKRVLEGRTSLTVQTIADLFAALGRSVRVVDQPLTITSLDIQLATAPGDPGPIRSGAEPKVAPFQSDGVVEPRLVTK